jgi:hypothetical protein
MILEWRRFTENDISVYLPFLRSCLKFHIEHFGIHGKTLHIAPSQSMEMYFDATDPAPHIAVLQAALNGLVNAGDAPGGAGCAEGGILKT